MSFALHCDREGCDTWQRIPALHWLVLTDSAGTGASHFCTMDCLLHWTAANSVPTERIDLR